MPRKNGELFPLLLGLWIALAVVCALTQAADNPLTAETPVPDQDLLEMVISTDYPQQTRMNVMTRVAEQAVEDDRVERADWFAAIVKNSSALSVVRGHALDQLFIMKYEPEGLAAWVMAAALDQGAPLDWRLACLSRLDGVYDLSVGEEREGIPALLSGIAEGESGLPSATALLTLARLGRGNEAARIAATAAMGNVFAASAPDPERVLSALQAMALLGDATMVTSARSIALDVSRNLRERMAAIGVLGEVGSAEDVAVLNQARGSSPILRKVAERALATLRARLAQ